MAFQQPFDIVGMRNQMMREEMMRQQQQQQMFDNIGGAIDNLLGGYIQNEEKKAKGRAMKNVFGVIAPSLGMDENTLKQLTGNLKSDKDWYNFGSEVGPMLPSMINATLAQGRMGIQQRAPYVEAGLKNKQNIAGGNVPHGGMGVPRPPSGMANVEPDLPVDDEDLPAVKTPAAVAPMQIPGGDESMRRYNEWKRQRGY